MGSWRLARTGALAAVALTATPLAAITLACASAAEAQAQQATPNSPLKPGASKPAAPPQPGAGPQRKPPPQAPLTKTAGKPTRHHALQPRRRALAGPAQSGVLAAAGCYGRFIGWRDELAGLMLQAGSYTPWPDDRIRFDGAERTFAASAKRERNLTLTLQPSFKESDFPADVRAAFRAGIKLSTDRFAEGGYRHTQIMVIGQPGLSPAGRMAQLEANTDEAFAPLAAPCEAKTAP